MVSFLHFCLFFKSGHPLLTRYYKLNIYLWGSRARRIVSSLAIFFMPIVLSNVLFFPSNVLSVVCANTSLGRYQNTSNFVSYQDVTLGIKFQHPEKWNMTLHYSENNSRIGLFSLLQIQFEIFPPSFVISLSNTSDDPMLDRLSKTIIEKGRQS